MKPLHLSIKWSRCAAILASLAIYTTAARAQDPVLPAANLGLANINDGITPGAGIYYSNFTQLYQAHSFRDAQGDRLPTDLKINSYFTIHQFVYLSKVKVFDGLLGFTAFLPIVRITGSNASGPVPSINSGALGDVIVAPAIVWENKRLFNHPFFHRAELDAFLPTGSYDAKYAINPGANHYTFSAHYTFTYFFSPSWSISSRNHISYNTRIRGTKARPGMFYNVNYSLEKTLYKTLKFELCGYFLKQIEQDAYDGNHQFFQQTTGISDTREQVLGIGPGLAYLANQRLVLEGKVFFEAAVRNRQQGIRPSMQIAYKF